MRARSSAWTKGLGAAGRALLMFTLAIDAAFPSKVAALPPARPASVLAGAPIFGATHPLGHPVDAAPDAHGNLRSRQVAATESYLRHAYSIYLGLKACSELRTEQNDPSFLPTVSLEDARNALHAIDSAASAVGIDVSAQWVLAAPKAIVTAEALKREPERQVAVCQRIGSIFRDDEANLQNLLGTLGSKQVLIPKDF